MARTFPMLWCTALLVPACIVGDPCRETHGAQAIRVAAESIRVDARPDAAVTVTPLVTDIPGVGGLAVSVNGQTVYGIDEERKAVVSFDPFDPDRRRDVVAAAAEGLPIPVAVGCLPGDLLAVVCRQGDDWTVRTHRIRPGVAADPAEPLQSLAIGRAGGSDASVGLAVSHSRDWLAVVGIPSPVPPVLRAVFAGASVRPLSVVGCPVVAADSRPLAIAVSRADELVLLEAADAAAPAAVSFHGPTGRGLMRLDTGLAHVRGVAFGRNGAALWVLAGSSTSAEQPEGLWRLDAVLRDGRQAIKPTCVARLAAPRAIVAVSEHSLVVVHGHPRRTIVRVDPHDGHRPHQEAAAP